MTYPLAISEYYKLPDTLERDELLGKLTSEHALVLDPRRKKKEEFLDTFDRHLLSHNLVLIKESGSYRLKNINNSDTLASLTGQSRTNPRFWWDFPKSEIKKLLKTRINIRALLVLAKIERSITTLRLINEDKKTILFLYVKDIRALGAGRKTPSTIIQVKAVRGYGEEARKFKKRLHSLGLKLTRGDLLTAAGINEGKYPLDYSSKINVELKAGMKSADALKCILRNLLGTMRANEFGVKKDIDTEFLHDFRVAVRRTRSALTQIKDVFAPDVTNKFKEDFSKIGKATNLLRDLDVYLLTESAYKNMLPEDLRPGLDPLFETLAHDREKAVKECAKFLESGAYKKILAQWEEFLNSSGGAEAAPEGGLSVLEVAKKRIWKKYRKVIKMGSKINRATPSPALHMLRIECKKLRYLLEFFGSLFPRDETAEIIMHLKRLQDNLGDFNDLHVQQESLNSFLNNPQTGYDSLKNLTQAAIGGLVSILYQKQAGVRKKFGNNFKEFSGKETSTLFTKLFAGD